MLFKTNNVLRFLLKFVAYVCLISFFYYYQITEVLNKYQGDYTNVAISEETFEDGIKPPFITLCMNPRAKQTVLDKYNLSIGALNEPNRIEKEILKKLNKTIEEFFLEATFKLVVDFNISMFWWFYNNEGWTQKELKISLGHNFNQVFQL